VRENRGLKSRHSNGKVKRILGGIVDFIEVKHLLTLHPKRHPYNTAAGTSTTHPRLVSSLLFGCVELN
jgi:hypothetical protein